MRYVTGSLLIALMLSARAAAQATDPTIETAVVTNERQMTVVFSQALANTPAAPHFDTNRVRLLPDNVVPTSIVQNVLARDTFTVDFAAVPATAARICFDQVQFPAQDGTVVVSSAQVCSDLSRDPASIKAEWIAAFQEVPKASREKDLFASGFVTTAADDSAGGADISLNPDLNIPNLNTFFQLKKATADEGDARHFEAGARYRYTRTWKPDELREIAAETNDARVNELIRARQRNIVAGWLVDAAGKLEADPTNFDVSNFVVESGFHLQSMTKGFFGNRAFWRGYVVPGGIEFGQSLGTTVPTPVPPEEEPLEPEVNRIARYKAGAGLTVFLDSPGTQLGLRRLEIDINAVMRQLFLTESRFNDETNVTDTTDKGFHGYAQIDFKVFLVQTSASRYGFKLSFNRGRLPPVYAQVNSFDFGFLVESGDDNGQATR
jgi:hypothetical protein